MFARFVFLGKKCIENIVTDEVIRPGARLYDVVGTNSDTTVIHLAPTRGNISSHNRPLSGSELQQRWQFIMKALNE